MGRQALALILLSCGTPLAAQNGHTIPSPEVRAVRLTERITLDGRLAESVWRTAPPADGFRQNQPREGQPATQRTEVRFAYDGEAVYIGARMDDSLGAAGVQTRLVRRDGDLSSDYLTVIFDPYHDHIGRLFFTVNPSGVRADADGLGGGEDDSWDPVWEVKTAIDDDGWTAEIRIPFSQLRYPETRDAQTWGLQIWRAVNRLNEIQMWSFWGLQETGGPSRFGHLSGLEIQASPQRAEILPYVVGRSTNEPVIDPDDPFAKAHTADGRFGADARVLLTSNLTLNLSVNPDFGQVEVDPAVVNLSAFETFFSERRPFFVEGAGYFGFGGLNCYFCSNVSSLSMFYSRRIGRYPQAAGNAFDAGSYADVPENTNILGAAKLTGRTASGWSVGVLDAVTRRERATVQRADDSRTQVTVEPFTNYFVGRVARDLRDGATVLRGIVTSVVRNFDDPALGEHMSRHAESVGLGTDWWFGNRDYRLMAQFAGTQVTGDAAAMLRLQRSSARYFQRPDREHGRNGFLTDAFDPSLTVMRGLGAYARFARESGSLLWEVATNVRTPGFENNDIAFLSRADYWWMHANVFPQFTRPTSWYRTLFFIGGGQQQYNFDGDLTDRQAQVFGYWQLLNYWNIQTFYIHRWELDDDRLTRGGPVVERAALDFWQASVSTDSRKALVLSANPTVSGNADGARSWSADLGVTWRPASNISISLGPSYNYGESAAQYVTSIADTTAVAFFGRRYVFAGITQRTLSMNTRLNITFTPNLTLELFAQPFMASADYDGFREFAAPRQLEKLVYGLDVGTVSSRRANGVTTYTIDPDADGPADAFELDDPSFTFRSLRGNAVLRWEYMPGSTLFLVWTRQSASSIGAGDLRIGRDAEALFEGPAENIFLVKVNYRLGA
ncbi:MAG TPA: DUF5916 domain-containing protein [Gemmatimonadales bacterium]